MLHPQQDGRVFQGRGRISCGALKAWVERAWSLAEYQGSNCVLLVLNLVSLVGILQPKCLALGTFGLPIVLLWKWDLTQSESVGVRDCEEVLHCLDWRKTFYCDIDTGRGLSNGCPCLPWDICSCSTSWVECVLPILLLPWQQLPMKLFMVLGKKWSVVLLLKMSLMKCFL